jgi:hypothetical protein
VRANPLIQFVNLADNRGPDRRRSGPHPERISSCYIKALRSSELGSRFGAYSHTCNPNENKRTAKRMSETLDNDPSETFNGPVRSDPILLENPSLTSLAYWIPRLAVQNGRQPTLPFSELETTANLAAPAPGSPSFTFPVQEKLPTEVGTKMTAARGRQS